MSNNVKKNIVIDLVYFRKEQFGGISQMWWQYLKKMVQDNSIK